MCPGEGDGSAGGGGGSSAGGDSGGGGSIGDILRYLDYLRQLGIGKDGDYTGNAGYYGDNIGPVGSKEPEKDEDRSTELVDVLMAPPGQLARWPLRPGIRSDESRKVEPYGGGEAPMGSLFAFAGKDVDVYSDLPLSSDSPDPFTGLPAADPFAEAERPARARSTAPRRTSLLSSRYLLADNSPVIRMIVTEEEERNLRANKEALAPIEKEFERESNTGAHSKPVVNPETDPESLRVRVFRTHAHSVAPQLDRVPDTGSNALNYGLGMLYSLRNLAAALDSVPLAVFADVHKELDRQGISLEALPVDAVPLVLAEGTEYLAARAALALNSSRLTLPIPGLGAGGLGMVPARAGARTAAISEGFQVAHGAEFYGQGAVNAEAIESSLSGQGVYQLIGDHPPDQLGQTVVRVGEGAILDRFAAHAHGPDQRLWRGLQVIAKDESLSQRLTLEADIGLSQELMLSGESSSLYKLPGNPSLGAFAGAGYNPANFTLLNPALYPSARLKIERQAELRLHRSP